MEEIKKLATQNGLTFKNVTAGANGYPVPYVGDFIGGFDTFQQVEEFAKAHDGRVVTVKWKDGWKNCEMFDTITVKPIKITDEDYGDNYQIIDSFEEFEGEKKDWIDDLDLEDDKERIEAILKSIEDFRKETSHVDWSKERVILNYGEYYETIKKELIYWAFDTYHYEIGVFFSND